MRPRNEDDGDAVPDIDVVVLTWNDGPLLDVAVRSALETVAFDVRVIVVDNGSQPPTEVQRDDRVVLLRNEENRGVAAGRNQGAAAGDAALICFLDSDAELVPHSLRVLASPLQDPDVAVAVPVFDGQPPEASAGRAPTLRVKLARGLGRRATYVGVDRSHDADVWDVDFGIGACQLIRRSAFDEVGGLDESIFYGPEDVDFCLRVRAAGHRVVQVPGAGVRHPPRRANRKPFTLRGARHGVMIVRHLWRHRAMARWRS